MLLRVHAVTFLASTAAQQRSDRSEHHACQPKVDVAIVVIV